MAAIYLYAYIQRTPVQLTNEPALAVAVDSAYWWSLKQIRFSGRPDRGASAVAPTPGAATPAVRIRRVAAFARLAPLAHSTT
jgi:hypothetical protein